MPTKDEKILHLAYAEASVVLIESLMLVLMERGVLSKDELFDALETSIETKKRFVDDEIHAEIAKLAAGTLTRIANSLSAAERRRPDSGAGGSTPASANRQP